MENLQSNETKLSGSWNLVGNLVEADSVTKRIEELVSGYLKYIRSDSNGWSKLYQDPKDNRYWELIYSNSEEQGGGAPTLQNLSEEEVRLKYKL